MATSVLDSGPLDDYFKDNTDDETESRDHPFGELGLGTSLISQNKGGNVSDGESSNSGDTTLVNNNEMDAQPKDLRSTTTIQRKAGRGWTGILPNISGPSNENNNNSEHLSPDIAEPGHHDEPTTTINDAFAEKFKYLICSSGLLEKDFVAISRIDPRSGSEVPAEQNEDGDGWSRLLDHGGKLVEKGKERWDIALAAFALLLGLLVGLGTKAILVLLVGAGGGLIWYLGYFVMSINPTISAELVETASSPSTSPQSLAITSLTKFITQSHLLDTSLDSASTLLQPHSSLTTHQTLRITLNRLTGNMTDHLATATSTLLSMADRKELAVLGEMYDIPVVGSFFYSRRGRPTLSISESEEELPSQITANVPSPKRPSLPHRPSSTPSPENPTPLANAQFRETFPVSASQQRTHSHRTQHLSLTSSSDDRFTSLPSRTPRLSKRASMEILRARDDQNMATVRKVAKELSRRPKHERRITEADEEAEADADESFASASSEEDKRDRGKENRVTPFPITPTAHSRASLRMQHTPSPSPSSPFKRISSPLARRWSNMSSYSNSGIIPLRTAPLVSSITIPTTPLLPSPFEQDLSSAPQRTSLSPSPMPNPKRRSLQNIPYYPPSDDSDAFIPIPNSADLSRSRSMPFYDLQALRSASATGSRRSSFVYGPGPGIGLPSSMPQGQGQSKRFSNSSLVAPASAPVESLPPRLRRVESVSPLTTPALKASCLGIHLKRRRMACCLLGLKFIQDQDLEETYWREVRNTIDELTEAMKREKEILDGVLMDAQKEENAFQTLERISKSDSHGHKNWQSMSSIFALDNNVKDYAPRTRDETLLVDNLDLMSKAIVGMWSDIQQVRETLAKDDKAGNTGLQDIWSGIRGTLGEMTREWERGKDVVTRLSNSHSSEKGGEVGSSNAEQEQGDEANDVQVVPDFMKEWESSSVNDKYSKDEPLNNINDEILEEEEKLPRPGKDTIFEGTSLLSTRSNGLSGLSRDERIALTKIAREKGISVKDMMVMNELGDDRKEEKEGDVKRGLVVDELRGVIGLIRQMKEGSTSTEEANEGKYLQAQEDGFTSVVGVEEKENGDGRPRTRSSAELVDRWEIAQLIDEGDTTPHSRSVTAEDTYNKDSTLVDCTFNKQMPLPLASPLPFDIGELKRSFRFPPNSRSSGLIDSGDSGR